MERERTLYSARRQRDFALPMQMHFTWTCGGKNKTFSETAAHILMPTALWQRYCPAWLATMCVNLTATIRCSSLAGFCTEGGSVSSASPRSLDPPMGKLGRGATLIFGEHATREAFV